MITVVLELTIFHDSRLTDLISINIDLNLASNCYITLMSILISLVHIHRPITIRSSSYYKQKQSVYINLKILLFMNKLLITIKQMHILDYKLDNLTNISPLDKIEMT